MIQNSSVDNIHNGLPNTPTGVLYTVSRIGSTYIGYAFHNDYAIML